MSKALGMIYGLTVCVCVRVSTEHDHVCVSIVCERGKRETDRQSEHVCEFILRLSLPPPPRQGSPLPTAHTDEGAGCLGGFLLHNLKSGVLLVATESKEERPHLPHTSKECHGEVER